MHKGLYVLWESARNARRPESLPNLNPKPYIQRLPLMELSQSSKMRPVKHLIRIRDAIEKTTL
jgi:hypothetical protein